MHSLFREHSTLVIAVVIVVAVVVRRFAGERFDAKDALVPPAVLVGVSLLHLDADELGAGGIAVVVVTSLVGLGFGVWRGLTLRLERREDGPYVRYRWVTLGVFLGSLTVGGLLQLLVNTLGLPEGGSVSMDIGIGLLGEAAATAVRLHRGGGGLSSATSG